jgi:amidohydrolase
VDTPVLKERAAQEIERLGRELRELSLYIHANPELALQERIASSSLADRLEGAGFAVERGVAGMETAFTATLPGRGAGPEVAIMAEYDALPGLGHACGHNIIATAALGAGLGLRAVMDSLDGTLVVMGTPAEEVLTGKLRMVDAGLFETVDAAIMIHPGNVTQLGRLFTASTTMEMIFHGRSTHAAASPDRGINALDACIATFNGTNALRKHLADGSRVHGVILEGGTAANIVPDRARAVFSLRARDRVYLEKVIAGVRACAEAGAMMAGARVDIHMKPICPEVNNNHVIAEAFGRNAAALGHEVLPADMNRGGGSTDMGAVSQVVPAIHPIFKTTSASADLHSRDFQVASASEEAQEAMIQGAKALAMTAIDLWMEPDLLRRAREEFEGARRG